MFEKQSLETWRFREPDFDIKTDAKSKWDEENPNVSRGVNVLFLHVVPVQMIYENP